MANKNSTGVPAKILAVFVAIATLSLLFGGATVYAQQATITTLTSGPGASGSMPLWFAIQNNVETHAGDLQNNMFQYRINNAPGDVEKAWLIELRSSVLQNATTNAHNRIQAMAAAVDAEGITDELYAAVVQLVSERINITAQYVNSLLQQVDNIPPGVLAPAIGQEISALQEDVADVIAQAMQLRHHFVPPWVPPWNNTWNNSWNGDDDWEDHWNNTWNNSWNGDDDWEDHWNNTWNNSWNNSRP